MKVLITGDSMIKYFEQYLPSQLKDYSIHLAAFRGITIERLSQKVSSLAVGFDVVLLHVGTNNDYLSAQECFAVYKRMVDGLLLKNYRVIMSAILPRQENLYVKPEDAWNDRIRVKNNNKKFAQLNKMLFEFSLQDSKLHFCESEKSWRGCMAKDGLHLNQRGNRQLSDYFVSMLTSILPSTSLSLQASSDQFKDVAVNHKSKLTKNFVEKKEELCLTDFPPLGSHVSISHPGNSSDGRKLYSSVLLSFSKSRNITAIQDEKVQVTSLSKLTVKKIICAKKSRICKEMKIESWKSSYKNSRKLLCKLAVKKKDSTPALNTQFAQAVSKNTCMIPTKNSFDLLSNDLLLKAAQLEPRVYPSHQSKTWKSSGKNSGKLSWNIAKSSPKKEFEFVQDSICRDTFLIPTLNCWQTTRFLNATLAVLSAKKFFFQ